MTILAIDTYQLLIVSIFITFFVLLGFIMGRQTTVPVEPKTPKPEVIDMGEQDNTSPWEDAMTVPTADEKRIPTVRGEK